MRGAELWGGRVTLWRGGGTGGGGERCVQETVSSSLLLLHCRNNAEGCVVKQDKKYKYTDASFKRNDVTLDAALSVTVRSVSQ